MDLGLSGRVVWIAGSSRGIGLAIARAFLAEGSRVAITGRSSEDLQAAERTLAGEFTPARVMSCRGDLAKPSVVADTLAVIEHRWGGVECLVSAVGSGTARAGWELGDVEWAAVMDHNLAASRRLAEGVLPGMVSVGRGSIVFVSSIAGVESLNAPLTYSAAKAALISYSKNLSRQVGPLGVRVNCLAPGNVLFPGGSWDRKAAERPDEVRQLLETEVPLRRFGTPAEIAAVAAFLASDCASFIAGACVVVDGGQTRSC